MQTNIKSSEMVGRSKYYLIYLVLFMMINDLFDSYTTNLPNVIGSFVIKDFGISQSAFAFVTAIASIGTYLAFINQFLVDFVGRRKMLFVVLFGTGLASLLLGLAPNIESYMLFLFFLYINFSSDIWTIVMNEESPKDKRGYYTNVVLIFGAIGAFLIILFRETLVYMFNWRSLTWFAILAIPFAFFSFMFQESKKFEEFSKLEIKKQETLNFKLKKIRSHKEKVGFFVVFIVSFIFGLNYILYAMGEPYFSMDRHFAQGDVSFIMTMMGLGAIIGYGLNAILLDRLGRKPTICIYVGSTFIMLILMFFGDLLTILISSLFFSAAYWGLFSALKIVCIEIFPTDIRGVGTGIRSFCFAFGFTVASVLAAILIPLINLGGVFFIISLVSLINIPLILLFIKETKGLELEIA